jgi:hypothetical protein
MTKSTGSERATQRRRLLKMLGLAAATAYAAPVMTNLSEASAQGIGNRTTRPTRATRPTRPTRPTRMTRPSR